MLLDGPKTYAQLAQGTGLAQRIVSVWVREWMRQGLVRVGLWLPDGRGYPTIAAFEWAPGQPSVVKKPKAE